MSDFKKYINETFNVSIETIEMAEKCEKDILDIFNKIEETGFYNQLKVLSAMQKNKLSEAHFAPSTGYGYNDIGRDVLEAIYADIFKAEDALVRPQIVSGTHALAVALGGNLRPGDEIFSPVGAPYDTLLGVIGIRREKGDLAEYGISYRQTDLLPNGDFDFDAIKRSINENTKLALIQRSKGYAWRKSLSIDEIERLIAFLKGIKPDIICMVDNCYGEFVETKEPIEVGADLCVGSLIKNPGGGLAPSGGYIVGKKEYVENSAFRLTAPGLGKEVGATLGLTSTLLQGLFLAPTVVSGSLKGAVFASRLFEEAGFETLPKSYDKRSDIVQAAKLKKTENLIAFCEGIQKGAPVDSFVKPVPWDMPGYDCPVIMAAGAFVSGSSIELSADAPLKSPYIVYFQGGLTWEHCKIGVIIGMDCILKKQGVRK